MAWVLLVSPSNLSPEVCLVRVCACVCVCVRACGACACALMSYLHVRAHVLACMSERVHGTRNACIDIGCVHVYLRPTGMRTYTGTRRIGGDSRLG